MTKETEKNIVDKVKAAAFPVMLTLTAWFMYQIYSDFKDEFKKQNERDDIISNRINTIDVKFELINYRLNKIDNNTK